MSISLQVLDLPFGPSSQDDPGVPDAGKRRASK